MKMAKCPNCKTNSAVVIGERLRYPLIGTIGIPKCPECGKALKNVM